MQPETKLHYRMYKDGKNWVFAAVALAFFGVGAMTTTVHADDVPATNQPAIEKPASAPASQTTSAAASQTSAGSEKASTASEATSIASSAKSDAASNSGVAKSVAPASEQQSQTSGNSSSEAKSDAQSVSSAENQSSQTSTESQSQAAVKSVASQDSQNSQAVSSVDKTSDAQTVSQAPVTRAQNLEFTVEDSSRTAENNVDSTSNSGTTNDASTTTPVNKPTVNKTSVAADGKTVTISPNNFDSYFTANGSAKYDKGQVTLTDGKDQSGNITLKNQMDPNYAFIVNGGVSMELGKGDDQNADGISFIFHPGSTDMVGEGGGALGIGGLPNSFGFKIDNFFNGDDINSSPIENPAHKYFYADPSLDREGDAITDGEAYGAFVYTDGNGFASTYGGPNGKDYSSYQDADGTWHWTIGGVNHFSADGHYSKTNAENDNSDATADKLAGPLLVKTPSETHGKNVPISMEYEPKMVKQLNEDGTAVRDKDDKLVFKFEHLMTVRYGGPDVNGDVAQPLTTWTIDITPWLAKKTDGSGTYEPLSFAMAASTGTHYNLQEMNYESFRYVSEAAINVKYETQDADHKLILIPKETLENPDAVTSYQIHSGIHEMYTATAPATIASNLHSSNGKQMEYVLQPAPANAHKFAEVLNPDVIFTYDLKEMSDSNLQTIRGEEYDVSTSLPITEVTQFENASLDKATRGNFVTPFPKTWTIPAGYTLVTSDSELLANKIAEKLAYTVGDNDSLSIPLTGSNQNIHVWLAPMQYGQINIKLVDKKTGKILKSIPNYWKIYANSNVDNIPPYYEDDKIDGYLPVDPNVQKFNVTPVSGQKNYDFTFYYVPSPILDFKVEGKIINTTTQLNPLGSDDLVFSPSTDFKISDTSMPESHMVTEKDNRTDDSDTITTFTLSEQKALFGDQVDNYDFSKATDIRHVFQDVPTSNFDKYNPYQTETRSYDAKPASLTVNITSSDGALNNILTVTGGTLLGKYKVSAPETVVKNGVTYKISDISPATGTYVSDKPNEVMFNYVVQPMSIQTKDIDILIGDKNYTALQNFISLTNGKIVSGNDAASREKAYDSLKVDASKVNISEVGRYPVVFTAADGTQKTAYTNVIYLKLRPVVLYVGQKWTPSDSFIRGLDQNDNPISVDDLRLVSDPILTDKVRDGQIVKFEYGDPVEVQETVSVVPNPDQPATTPETPVTTPEKPATTPKTPVTTPEKPATTPETPVTTPEKPVTTPEVPVTKPEQPATVAETPTPVDHPATPAQTPDVPVEPTTPTEPAQPATVANVTPNVPAQPVLTPTATAQPMTPVSSDRTWDPIELIMTDDDNGQIITTTEIQGYTGNWVYIGNVIPAGYHLAPGQSDWILLNDVTPQTVHLVADAVDQTSTAAAQTTVAPAATVAQQSVPATVVKEATAPTTKTTDETDQPAAAELPHTGELATTAAMGTGLALLTGLLSLFGLRRKQH